MALISVDIFSEKRYTWYLGNFLNIYLISGEFPEHIPGIRGIS